MMDPLNSLDSISELIRRRALEAATSKLDKSHSDKLSQARQKHIVSKVKTAESVRLKIINAISAIGDNDENKDQKLVGIFVQNVLLWQFGDELINDPSFINLVDEVSATLSKEPLVINQLKSL